MKSSKSLMLSTLGFCALNVLLLTSCVTTRVETFHLKFGNGKADTPKNASAVILERGYITCFPEGLSYANGKLVPASPSCAVFDGKRIIMGNDKPVPGAERSPVFYVEYPAKSGRIDTEPLHYLTEPAYIMGLKYECATITSDNNYTIVSTGFSAIGEVPPVGMPYETMLIHPRGNPSDVKVVNEAVIEGFSYSAGIRRQLSKALANEQYPDGPPYFNAEGLTSIPGNKLLFGIRQIGTGYDSYEYVMKIIQVSYQTNEKGELKLHDDAKVVYDVDQKRLGCAFSGFGISSLEYDRFNKRLYMLSAFELSEDGSDEDLGTYFWTLSLKDMYANKLPVPVKKRGTNQPLVLSHRMEGLAVLDDHTVFIVADDDNITGRAVIENPETQFSRTMNKAAYAIIDVSRN